MKNITKPIIIMSLVTGTLDGFAAVIMYCSKTGKDPMNVFRFIANGMFGKDAFGGGLPMASLGILFHYLIAFGWTWLFYFAATRIDWLVRNWILTGVLYGVFVWLLMNLVVVPLSLVPMKSERDWTGMITGTLILIICIGLPLAFSASRLLKKQY